MRICDKYGSIIDIYFFYRNFYVYVRFFLLGLFGYSLSGVQIELIWVKF